MIKKIFTNKVYFLTSMLVLLLILSIVASVVSSNRNNKIPYNLNPFAQNNNLDTTNKTITSIEDPVLKFFLDQNSKLKLEMNLVDQIDQDIPTPVIVWKVDFK